MGNLTEDTFFKVSKLELLLAITWKVKFGFIFSKRNIFKLFCQKLDISYCVFVVIKLVLVVNVKTKELTLEIWNF